MRRGPSQRTVALHGVPPDPIAMLSLSEAATRARFWWSSQDGRLALAGLGVAAEVVTQGPRRFAAAAARAPELWGETDPDPLDGGSGPRAFGAFGFTESTPGSAWQGFAPGRLVVPEVLLAVEEEAARLSIAVPGTGSGSSIADRLERLSAEPDLPPEEGSAAPAAARRESFEAAAADGRVGPALDESVGSVLVASIERALAAIDRGSIDKVVVSTSCTVELDDVPDPVDVLRSLRREQPNCSLFMVAPMPGVAFLGASPEVLVRLAGGRLSTVALAGSASRDADPSTDSALGEALLADPKERAEHDMVVAAIQRDLRDYAPLRLSGPSLRKLATIQHIETSIEADIPAGTHVLELAGRLHPTPALGGWPRKAALTAIAELENHPRGLYGGAVGWIDPVGNGELSVAIRSMLLRGRTATAFAGAGIVSGSVPALEAAEIRRKLSVALGALLYGNT